MIVTSFTLRSPCSWKLQYVRSSVLVEPLQRCTCTTKVDVALPLHRRITSTSTPPSPLYIYIFTRSHPQIYLSPPHHTHTSAHLYHICTSTLSLLHICPVFLSFYISFISSMCIYIFVRSHPQIYLSTSIHPQIYVAPAHHTVTPSHPPSLSLFLYIFSTVLDNYMSRSRANHRLVFWVPRFFEPIKPRPSTSLGIGGCQALAWLNDWRQAIVLAGCMW